MSVGEHSAAAFAEERTLCARPIAALRELMQVAKVRSMPVLKIRGADPREDGSLPFQQK